MGKSGEEEDEEDRRREKGRGVKKARGVGEE